MFGPPRPPDRGPLQELRRRRPLAPPRVQRTVSAQAPFSQPYPQQPNVDVNQAVGLAGQQIDPMLKQITEMYNRRAGDISGGISSLTGQYQNALSEYAHEIPGLFQHSLHLIKNTGEGLNAELTGFGKQQFRSNNAAFDAAGLPHDAGGGDINLRDIGSGAGATAGAIGQAMLDALKAQQDNAEGYASKLPGFAGLEGAQNTQNVLGVLARRLADDLSTETARTPGLVYQIYQDMLGRQDQDRSYNEQVRQFNVSRQDQLNAKKAGVAGPNAPTVAGRVAYWRDQADKRTQDTGDLWVGTSTGIRPYDADPRKPGIQRQRTAQGQGADYLNLGRQASAADRVAKPTRPNASLSKAYGYVVDSNGNPILRNGNKIPVAKTPPKGKTPPKVDTTLSKALGQWVDSTGNPIPALAGKPVPKPKKTPGPQQNVDLDLSIVMGQYVDGSGRPIPSLAGKKPPKRKPGTGAAAKAKTGGFDPSTGQYGP